MPTITHAIIGGAIGLLLYTFSINNPTKRFKSEHVIVLSLNSFVGPDWSKFLSPFYGADYWNSNTFIILNGFSHTIIGWWITGILFTFIYYYIFKFTKEKKETGYDPISLQHIYMLVGAGGMNHFALDMLDAHVSLWPKMWGNSPSYSIESFLSGPLMSEGPYYSSLSWLDDKYLLIIGLSFMILLIWELKNKNLKTVWLTAIIMGIFIYLIIILEGSAAVNNESDLGILIYITLGWIGPLALEIFSMDPPNKV